MVGVKTTGNHKATIDPSFVDSNRYSLVTTNLFFMASIFLIPNSAIVYVLFSCGTIFKCDGK